MKNQNSPSSRLLGLNIRWVRWAGTILTSALFLWLLLQQDWQTMWATMQSLSFWLVIIAVGLYFSAIMANAWRWYVLLRAQQVAMTYRDALKIVLAGNFASNFLPTTVGGDSVRIVSAARFTGWSISLASVVVDRLLNVLLMVLLLPISWVTLHATGTMAVSWQGWRMNGSLLWAGAWMPSVGKKFGDTILRWLKKIYRAFMVWRNHPAALVNSFLISFFARMMVFIAMWILARDLEMSLTLVQVIGVSTLTYVLSTLPISINGLGLREVTMTALFVQLGASLEQASALVMLTRFIILAETLPGALWVSDMLVKATKS